MTPPTPISVDVERAHMRAARAGMADSVRAVVARHRLGALVRDVDALAAAAGQDSVPADLLDVCAAVAALLQRLDRGPTDREWRARVWGSAQ